MGLFLDLSMLLERKHGLKMGAEMNSNIKYYCGRVAEGNSLAKYRLLVAISER